MVKHYCRCNPLFSTAYRNCNYYFAKTHNIVFLPLLPPSSSCYPLLIFLHTATGSKAVWAKISKITATTVNLRIFTGVQVLAKESLAKRNPRKFTGLGEDWFHHQQWGMFFEKSSIIIPLSHICKPKSGYDMHNQSVKSSDNRNSMSPVNRNIIFFLQNAQTGVLQLHIWKEKSPLMKNPCSGQQAISAWAEEQLLSQWMKERMRLQHL